MTPPTTLIDGADFAVLLHIAFHIAICLEPAVVYRLLSSASALRTLSRLRAHLLRRPARVRGDTSPSRRLSFFGRRVLTPERLARDLEYFKPYGAFSQAIRKFRKTLQ